MDSDFSHGTVHRAADDMRVAIETDVAVLAIWQSLTPLGRKALGAETQSWRRHVLAVEQLLRTT